MEFGLGKVREAIFCHFVTPHCRNNAITDYFSAIASQTYSKIYNSLIHNNLDLVSFLKFILWWTATVMEAEGGFVL